MSSSNRESAALRRELRARRAALTPGLRIAAAQQVAARLHSLPGLPDSGYVAGYWAVAGELALHAWQVSLPSPLVYCLPVLHTDGSLRFAPWRAGDPLVTNRFGIPEPDVKPEALLQAPELALAVVPLVGFDDRCHRLGMGGGWYDRTFAARQTSHSSTPQLVGVGYEIQRVDRLAAEPWDVQLDAVCTETSTYLRKDAAP